MHLRFNIRDIFWLAAFVAIAVAWSVDHRQLAEVNQQLSAMTQKIVTMYSLQNNVDRKEIVKTLQEDYEEYPFVKFVDDPANNAVVAEATDGEQIGISMAIRALEKNMLPAAAEGHY
jgi:hypothetical protein